MLIFLMVVGLEFVLWIHPSNNDSSKIVYCKLQFGKANTGVGEDYDMLGGAICAEINKLLGFSLYVPE